MGYYQRTLDIYSGQNWKSGVQAWWTGLTQGVDGIINAVNRVTLRRLLIGLATIVLYMSQPGPISAHAELVMATPAPGANLENLPDTIRLVFSEPVKPGAPLAIYNPQFQEVASLAPNWSAESPEEIWADMPSLATGTYTLQWQVLSMDGHPSTGSYQFSVTEPADNSLPIWTLSLLGFLIVTILVLGVMGIRRVSRSAGSPSKR